MCCAAECPADIYLSIVSVRHVVENARLVDVDSGATVFCEQAVSFVVAHGRSFYPQIHHSTILHFQLFNFAILTIDFDQENLIIPGNT